MPLVPALAPFRTTIFAEMSALAARTGAINLGQGFPDSDGPPAMLEAAQQAIRDGFNQYPPGPGIPALRRAIALARQRDRGQTFDPDTEVLVTVGATEAIAAAVIALVQAGDEVIMLEPHYDSYPAVVAMSGAKHVSVQLKATADRFALDLDDLAAAVTPRTRMILLNTPHNPTGTVLTRAELQGIADLAIEHDLVVVADEVYEYLTFDGTEHVPIGTLPGMAERTITVSSSGKTFAATGWKIGWACGPQELVAAVRAAKQFLTYVGGAPFQPAVAYALEHEIAWVAELRDSLQHKRDRLCQGLTAAGFEIFRPQGTYFVVTDIRSISARLGRPADGMAFCLDLPELAGVVAVPQEVFHDDPADGRPFVRFAFCKQDRIIDEAADRLARMSR
ncbi:N-succinyldiaminopimelate aminotransferase [Nakamurella panacisegetis]|uniref:N-succinyldiaminopimelate aminotransferase n=1 Tax=Nakamurella panacisegetis TaxID=1090615 RepID=A0A1H0NN28_9ACTN|nr:pyridoxal phosphate-dependent aminotransferase [Nakamurella panacisegetis]SDO93805.1 N-succinyldiaminopimelate aminotransferase [Nakamurella panacisegetis]